MMPNQSKEESQKDCNNEDQGTELHNDIKSKNKVIGSEGGTLKEAIVNKEESTCPTKQDTKTSTEVHNKTNSTTVQDNDKSQAQDNPIQDSPALNQAQAKDQKDDADEDDEVKSTAMPDLNSGVAVVVTAEVEKGAESPAPTLPSLPPKKISVCSPGTNSSPNSSPSSSPDSSPVKSKSSYGQSPTPTPYMDRSSVIIESLTESDKKTLRLYDDNAVIGGPFPVKLQIILKVTELLGQQHIISWLPHGRAFMIHRPREFEEKIMGEFFKQTKLSSFKRQLNLYDFQRVTRGTDCGSYYHEMFLRGKPLLAKRMVRRKIKGTKNQQHSSSTTSSSSGDHNDLVLDFYSMPPVGGMNGNAMGGRLGGGLTAGMMKRSPFMGNPQEQLYGGGFRGGMGLGGMADQLSSAALHSHHGGLQGPSHLGGAGLGGPGGLHHGNLLQNQGQGLHYDALSHSLLQQQRELQQLSSLQFQQQQLQLHQQQSKANGDFMMSNLQGGQLPQIPQQLHDSYAVTMENLNNSYALAASALNRNLGTGGFTNEELVAAKQLNRPGTNALNYQGW